MTLRDYQQTNNRAPRTRESSPVPSIPRVVTPTKSSASGEYQGGENFFPLEMIPSQSNTGMNSKPSAAVVEPDFVHRPTKEGKHSADSPMRPSAPQRYSLSKGKKSKDHYDDESLSKKFHHANSLALQKTPESSKRDKKKKKSSSRKYDPNAYKIFLLLLQPESKIFELIQLIYMPNDTTVGKIIKMIPENATEKALGSQKYIGLCRPKTEEELIDLDILASETSSGVVSAKITLGEILVAMPKGYSGTKVAALSKQILSNPKIVKLLKRADPLAPKKRRSRKHRSNRNIRSNSREHVDVLEKHDEAEEIKVESEQKMKLAMEHAAAEAAAANAAVSGGEKEEEFVPKLLVRQDSIGSDGQSLGSSLQDSVDESYSSWSKSFEASFSSKMSICSGVSRRQVRRRDRQAKRLRIIKRSSFVAFLAMVGLYMFDPKEHSTNYAQSAMDAPMGLVGLLQVCFLLLALYKIEKFIRCTSEGNFDSYRKCPFLKASDAAMQRFKGTYAKKLKKSGRGRDDDSLVSKRLRNYSLKTASFRDLDANDPSGSLY
mmetsp:Transcript_9621/g.22583  ORF Transcript_9621/g.22583 Transcript_9621/m.22583 type:complete len:546 (-) Transcript_9621:64-1701(-)|eukprot:CAMPEP_0113625334 /NCGR_PEP_ID=MMETSP0017_2-20120614/13086_1 /TAXON_ID=2856 /ORGANISM="Cylindrotheca closterium" /LENGTH=545 /DNA_ID=CAMNT_0000535445 /DNA_START=195 /DNA_END=1832 /DNA_ORIENTATION=+ /assembly_acc=CAM_ASM_000147